MTTPRSKAYLKIDQKAADANAFQCQAAYWDMQRALHEQQAVGLFYLALKRLAKNDFDKLITQFQIDAKIIEDTDKCVPIPLNARAQLLTARTLFTEAKTAPSTEHSLAITHKILEDNRKALQEKYEALKNAGPDEFVTAKQDFNDELEHNQKINNDLMHWLNEHAVEIFNLKMEVPDLNLMKALIDFKKELLSSLIYQCFAPKFKDSAEAKAANEKLIADIAAIEKEVLAKIAEEKTKRAELEQKIKQKKRNVFIGPKIEISDAATVLQKLNKDILELERSLIDVLTTPTKNRALTELAIMNQENLWPTLDKYQQALARYTQLEIQLERENADKAAGTIKPAQPDSKQASPTKSDEKQSKILGELQRTISDIEDLDPNSRSHFESKNETVRAYIKNLLEGTSSNPSPVTRKKEWLSAIRDLDFLEAYQKFETQWHKDNRALTEHDVRVATLEKDVKPLNELLEKPSSLFDFNCCLTNLESEEEKPDDLQGKTLSKAVIDLDLQQKAIDRIVNFFATRGELLQSNATLQAFLANNPIFNFIHMLIADTGLLIEANQTKWIEHMYQQKDRIKQKLLTTKFSEEFLQYLSKRYSHLKDKFSQEFEAQNKTDEKKSDEKEDRAKTKKMTLKMVFIDKKNIEEFANEFKKMISEKYHALQAKKPKKSNDVKGESPAHDSKEAKTATQVLVKPRPSYFPGSDYKFTVTRDTSITLRQLFLDVRAQKILKEIRNAAGSGQNWENFEFLYDAYILMQKYNLTDKTLATNPIFQHDLRNILMTYFVSDAPRLLNIGSAAISQFFNKCKLAEGESEKIAVFDALQSIIPTAVLEHTLNPYLDSNATYQDAFKDVINAVSYLFSTNLTDAQRVSISREINAYQDLNETMAQVIDRAPHSIELLDDLFEKLLQNAESSADEKEAAAPAAAAAALNASATGINHSVETLEKEVTDCLKDAKRKNDPSILPKISALLKLQHQIVRDHLQRNSVSDAKILTALTTADPNSKLVKEYHKLKSQFSTLAKLLDDMHAALQTGDKNTERFKLLNPLYIQIKLVIEQEILMPAYIAPHNAAAAIEWSLTADLFEVRCCAEPLESMKKRKQKPAVASVGTRASQGLTSSSALSFVTSLRRSPTARPTHSAPEAAAPAPIMGGLTQRTS